MEKRKAKAKEVEMAGLAWPNTNINYFFFLHSIFFANLSQRIFAERIAGFNLQTKQSRSDDDHLNCTSYRK